MHSAGKVLLIGPAKSGKTKYVCKARDYDGLCSNKPYIPTIGTEAHPILLKQGVYCSVWDMGGGKRLGSRGTSHYAEMDAMLVVCEDEDSVKRAIRKISFILPFCKEGIPIAIFSWAPAVEETTYPLFHAPDHSGRKAFLKPLLHLLQQ